MSVPSVQAELVADQISQAIMQVCDEHGPLAPRYAAKIIEAIVAEALRDAQRVALESVAKEMCPDHKPFCDNFYPDSCPANVVYEAVARLRSGTGEEKEKGAEKKP